MPQAADNATPLPPADIAAEQAVLGACLLNQPIIDQLTTILDGPEFYRPAHQTIYQTAVAMHTAGEPVDAITVADRLTNDGAITRVGGHTYLHDLTAGVPTTTNATYYAHIVAKKYRRRRAIETIQRAYQRVQGSEIDDTDKAIGEARSELDEIERTRDDRGPVNWTDFWTRPAEPPDLLAGGVLARARITVIYAPGKTGKSLLAQEIAVSLAMGMPILNDVNRPPLTVLYVDQEMTLDDWRDRFEDMRITPQDDLSRLHLYNLADWPPLDTAEGGHALAAAADYHGADLVVIDTLSKVCAGEENSNDTFGAFYRHTLVPLKRAGRAGLVLDHTGKDIERGARGGTAKTDNVDLVWEMLSRGKSLLSLKRTHVRFRHPTELIYLRRNEDPLLHEVETVDERAEQVTDHCLNQLRSWNIDRTASGRAVLQDFRQSGSKYTNETFWEAWRRFRYENGWTS